MKRMKITVYDDNGDDNDDLAIHLAIQPSSPPILSLNFKAFSQKNVNKFPFFLQDFSLKHNNNTPLNVKLPPKATRLEGEVSVAKESLQSEKGSKL